MCSVQAVNDPAKTQAKHHRVKSPHEQNQAAQPRNGIRINSAGSYHDQLDWMFPKRLWVVPKDRQSRGLFPAWFAADA
jgi:hypothetical protein